MKFTMCKNYEGYNVLHNDFVGDVYAVKYNSHSNDYIHLNLIHEKIPHITTSISYNSLLFNG